MSTMFMKYHSLFFQELGNMLQNLSTAAVMIGALRVNSNSSLSESSRIKIA